MTKKDEIKRLLKACSEEERLEIFQYLRRTIPIHAIEAKLNTQAEVILEAIDRASDLTLRGIRGIIAEAVFLVEVIAKLEAESRARVAPERATLIPRILRWTRVSASLLS